MSFICMRIKKKTFLINGFALSLALKPRHEAIRKQPIASQIPDNTLCFPSKILLISCFQFLLEDNAYVKFQQILERMFSQLIALVKTQYKWRGWHPPPPKVFLSFLPEDRTAAPDVFSSCLLIPRAHFESSSVMVSFYGYEI